MSKTLVIGAAGLLGSRVVEALGEDQCICASRNSGERVDISAPKSLASLFGRVGPLDGIICTGGAARFKPWEQMTDEDWAFSLANKLLGQVNVVRYGAKSVRPGGAITLTRVLRRSTPLPGAPSSQPSMPRSRLLSARSRRSRRLLSGSMQYRPGGSPRLSRRWAAIPRAAFRLPKSRRFLCSSCVRVPRARLHPLLEVEAG